MASPSMPNRTWLVHRTRSPGAASSRRIASVAAASTTCSQLSRITSGALPLSRSSSAGSPPGTFKAAISTSTTSFAVAAVSSLASQTPSSRGLPTECSLRPTSIATAVFPTPPDPTISTSRSVASRSHRSATTSSRPTRSADIDGRLPLGTSGTAPTPLTWVPRLASWARINCSSCCSCGRGSRPSSSASWFRIRWYVARASACRPARYSAVINSSQRLSWKGCAATAASSSPIRLPASPSRSRAENWISRSFVRVSASRTLYGSTQSPSPAAWSTSPR